MLEELPTRAPGLAPFVAKCYGGKPADVLFTMESGERRNIPSSTGVQQGDALGPALFCMPLGTVMEKVREIYEPKGVEAFAYMDDAGVALQELAAETVQVVSLLKEEACAIGVTLNGATCVALPPPGHVPTDTEMALLRGVGMGIAQGGGAVIVGIPVGTDIFVQNHAKKVVTDKGAEALARLLARMPDRQSAMFIATIDGPQNWVFGAGGRVSAIVRGLPKGR